MSFVVRPSGKPQMSRRNRARDDGPHGLEKNVRIKQKPKGREVPVERIIQPCKVVMRNLPSNFTKELFLQQVSPLPEYTYLAFHGPDVTLSNAARSRVYLRLKNEEDVAVVKEKFDGYIFVDSRGHELRCQVELAPYQRTAEQQHAKADPKCGQITETEEYKQFLENLEKPKSSTTTSGAAKIQANLAQLEKPKEEIVVTPLMEYLTKQRTLDEEMRRTPGSSRYGGRKERLRAARKNVLGGPNRKDPGPVRVKEALVERTSGPVGVLNRNIEGNTPVKTANQVSERSGKQEAPASPLNRPSGSDSARGPTEPSQPGEKGRHFFPERSHPAGNRRNENWEDSRAAPDSSRSQEARRAAEGAGRDFEYSSKKDVYYSRSGYDKGGKVMGNPITGSKEFAQSRPVEQRPAANTQVVEKVVVSKAQNSAALDAKTSASSAAESVVDAGPRVPNKARPTKELYQPKAKRRYQN